MSEIIFNKGKYNALETNPLLSPLAKAFFAYTQNTYNFELSQNLMNAMQEVLGKAVWQVKSVDEFMNSKVRHALAQLTDADYVKDIEEILRLRIGCQFSHSPVRRAFRSDDFGFYASDSINVIAGLIRLYFYESSVTDLMQAPDVYIQHQAKYFALKIRRGDKAVRDLIKDMILGDNNTLLERKVIEAIILSGDEELLDLLMNLLLAAKAQEGVRQAILESADVGSLETFLKIFTVARDNDLFRFSSAARALMTWTGTASENGNDKIEFSTTKRLAETAYKCLTDVSFREEMLVSPNPYDAYFAIWAKGCENVVETDSYVETLLTDEKPYRRSLGWYFVYQVENALYRHSRAVEHLDEPEAAVLARLTNCLSVTSSATWYYYSQRNSAVHTHPNKNLPEKRADRLALFNKLKDLVLRIGHSEQRFAGEPFPWSEVVLSNEDSNVLKCMMSLAAYDLDSEMINELASLQEYMDVDLRRAFYGNLIDLSAHSSQRELLYPALKDRSTDIREIAVRKLSEAPTKASDIENVCAILTSRSASLKKTAISYLKELNLACRKQAVELLAEGNDAQLQAAMELMLTDEKLAASFAELTASLKERKLSSQAELLLRQLTDKDTSDDDLDPENGYGLYDSAAIDAFVESLNADPTLTLYEEKLFSKKPAGAYAYIKPREFLSLMPSKEDVTKLYQGLEKIFDDHRDYEYTYLTWDGSRNTALFGQTAISIQVPEQYGNLTGQNYEKIRLHMLPFAEEFRKVLQPYIDAPEKYVAMALMTCSSGFYNYKGYSNSWSKSLHDLFDSLRAEALPAPLKKRQSLYCFVIRLAAYECDEKRLFDAAFRFYFSFLHNMGDEYLKCISTPAQPGLNLYAYYRNSNAIDPMQSELGKIICNVPKNDAHFRVWFLKEYSIRRRYRFCDCHVSLEDFLRALNQEIISEDVFCEWILHPDRNIPQEIIRITSLHVPYGQACVELYPGLPALVNRLTDHMVRYELRRGQAETPISGKVVKISRIVGAGYFNLLLRGLGSDNFFRGYSWSGDRTKPGVFSCLLRNCLPGPEDNADTLRELLKGSDIKENRLVEAAMYAPQWAPILEEYIGWPGLKKGIWFFQAHCSEHFSSDKETEVALFSPITPQEFNDGAFDIDWFNAAYTELGEKRFRALYKAAKYITDGSNAHRRSQLYTDAVTGKFDVAEMETEIADKRNQEKLRAYGLIPLGAPEGDKEAETAALLRRYEFIAKYKKESRQFGAARRDSERKAADTALRNLAITCGIKDVDRMLWRLESAKDAEIAPLLTPVTIDEYTVALSIDEEGTPSVVVTKDDRTLKTLPKSLAKDAYIEQLKQTAKELRDQKSRCRVTLEHAMIGRTVFSAEEITNIMASRTVAPQARKLLWINEAGEIGLIGEGKTGLIGEGETASDKAADNVTLPTITGNNLRIAHCHDLAASGKWGSYIRYAFDRKLIQPFKQIFREYYPVTDEEREEITISRRYAGYQVQPKKTMALLKTCGWTVDYEEGLQKVIYSSDMVARMYSYADWFSPADIEAPTLEEIRFYNRRTWEAIPLADIDPIVFSEVMRDFDLVVSTAYVGGVDPEVSHSTVEMRAAIAKELTGLLKLTNVTFLERHARIVGKLAEYSVHLGSGVVHAVGIGMIPILPVHSQHRGRIFLPFADEDPKTAEIMSKIILLSEDSKIKDPEILKYLK